MTLDTDDFELFCDICGASLEVTKRKNQSVTFDVQPCQSCLEDAENRGYYKGQESNE